MREDTKQCYVITPYERKDVGGGIIIDFEEVYQTVVKKAVESIDRPRLQVLRSKDEAHAGVITESFIKGIFHSDITIIDVSGNNPNVYYELGLRHAFRKKINVLIGFEGTTLPFDIAGIRVVWYHHLDEEKRAKSIRDIANHLRAAIDTDQTDSPVYKFLPNLIVKIPETPNPEKLTFEYGVKGLQGKTIGIKTGALMDIKDVDVWVNSENTEMEMARPYEKSISSIIRYFGAILDNNGKIKRDLIQNYLDRQVGRGKSVAPATVIATEPGELRTRGVKMLLHVASVEGQPGFGYRPIREVHLCVTRCLEKLQELNTKKRTFPLSSILLPIFGSGQGGQDPADVLEELVAAAVQYVKNHPQSLADHIYFLAYHKEQLALCKHVFAKFEELEMLER